MKYLKLFKYFEAYDENGNYYDENWIEPTGDEWHKSPEKNIKAAVEEIRKLGYPNDLDRSIIMIPPDWKTQISVKGWDGHVWLDVLTTELEREQGKATAIMNKMLEIADKYEVFVAIDPTPYGVGQKMDKKQLVEWAKKFGFHNIIDGNIERTPIISEERNNELLDKFNKVGEKGMSKEEMEMMRRYSGDVSPKMKPKYKKPRKLKLSNTFIGPSGTTEIKGKETEIKGKDFPVDPTYTHFAVRKSNKKIVDGWDYSNLKNDTGRGYDVASIKDYTKMDIKDHFPDDKYTDFGIYTTASLRKMNIDPFNWEYWEKSSERPR